MEKILLVDGYSLMFRAYYATAYGKMMTTSTNIPTNAIFAFSNMLTKVIEQIQPDKILVAFDSGKKNFRHELFEEYKGTRKEAPSELVIQFPIVREFLTAYGIPWLEVSGYEADDIIGSLSRRFADAYVDILSSDRDLLQLINERVNVLITKNGVTELKRMDLAALQEDYQLTPTQIIDLKGLMGDTSDNIPGIPKVGEKTAIKWLSKYHTLEAVLEHAQEIGGKMADAIVTYQDQARLSKKLATICLDIQVDITFEECQYQRNSFGLKQFYEKYEMRSLINRLDFDLPKTEEQEAIQILPLQPAALTGPCGLHYLPDFDVFLLSDCKEVYRLSLQELKQDSELTEWFQAQQWIIHHVKETLHLLKADAVLLSRECRDLHLASFLLDSNESTDLTSILHKQGIEVNLLDKTLFSKDMEEQLQLYGRAVKAFPSIMKQFQEKLVQDQLDVLYDTLELPLCYVLYDMEVQGIAVDQPILMEIAQKTKEKYESLADEIYLLVGHPFNLNSPKQMAEVLFDELGLPANKKRSTAVDILEKLQDSHIIINLILEYRKYSKLYSTYAEGLQKYIQLDGKIHTNYHQALAQTGRLSSKDPNLQNISVRNEETKEIRKAFVASSEQHILLSADYSQVELRMLAHMSESKELIQVFKDKGDIHTSTAMKIFHVEADQVTSLMRRQAKAINFGIVYGISDFGLAQQTGITRKEAQEFIERYFAAFPDIQPFMHRIVEDGEQNGYVKTILQRRRYIRELQDKNHAVREAGRRAAMNAPIQGSAADLIKLAMIHIDNMMKEQQVASKMILQVHDELIFDVVLEEVELMRQIVTKGMEEAMQLKVPLTVEVHTGKNWLEAK